MEKLRVFLFGFLVFFIVGCSSSFHVDVKENAVLEYGEKPDYSLLFDKEQSDEDVSVKEVKNFDSKKTGEQEITVIFTNADEKTKEETLKVTVKDTKKPEIKLKKDKLEITEGDKFDAVANIESVKDPVDGDIKKSDDKKLTKNGYFIASDVDVKKAGSYTVKITAFDVNGNKAESSYKVTVKAKPQEPEVQQPVNQTPTQTNTNNGYSNNQGSTSSNTNAPIVNNTPAPKPSTNTGSTSSQNTQKPQQPAVTKKVCPNGNEPKNPDLPCDAIISGHPEECYKDASGNIITFPTAEEANKWAYNALLNDSSFDIYAGYATLPLGRNDGTQCNGVAFK